MVLTASVSVFPVTLGDMELDLDHQAGDWSHCYVVLIKVPLACVATREVEIFGQSRLCVCVCGGGGGHK